VPGGRVTDHLPQDVVEILDRGDFCYVAAATRRGPHVTPMVFALAEGRVWVTTSRGSVKARAWRVDPAVAGMVRAADAAVVFAGTVRTYDLFEVGSWVRGLFDAPTLASASTRFTRKNARFFAGYAVDARHVPLSWTPPSRVFAAIEVERAAIVGPAGVTETVGAWPRSLPSIERFRAAAAGPSPLGGLPDDVHSPVGERGEGALALTGGHGLAVLPVAWTVQRAGLYAALAPTALELAGLSGARVGAALAIDRSSWWRARDMTGAMVRGDAEVAVPEALTAGAASAGRISRAAGAAEGDAIVRLRPEELVWWRGWTSGTVVA
ncbi:MAG TPA: pyridoxamine 5'-phosphate oxidase family protein, partial [Actinomycetota bacterium]|nr:pyridoxamine 5'-phosphate oxidase family protein [Actinomycetota bacterium]